MHLFLSINLMYCYGSAISSLRTQCSSCTRHSFCHTFIIVLQCGIFVEHATVKSYKRILRFILNDYTSHSETPLCLTKVEMTSLYNKRIQNFLILVKSLFFSNQYPTYMRNTFTVRHTTSNMRVTHMLTLSKPVQQQPMDYTLFLIFPPSNGTILSDVCNVSIRLISFH